MRILVRALLPLGEGVVCDPFMGSGSTIAAAEALGYESVGVEIDEPYFASAQVAIPRLAALYPRFRGEETEVEGEYAVPTETADQLDFALMEGATDRRVQIQPRDKGGRKENDPSPRPSPHPMGRGGPCLRQAQRGRQAEGG